MQRHFVSKRFIRVTVNLGWKIFVFVIVTFGFGYNFWPMIVPKNHMPYHVIMKNKNNNSAKEAKSVTLLKRWSNQIIRVRNIILLKITKYAYIFMLKKVQLYIFLHKLFININILLYYTHSQCFWVNAFDVLLLLY